MQQKLFTSRVTNSGFVHLVSASDNRLLSFHSLPWHIQDEFLILGELRELIGRKFDAQVFLRACSSAINDAIDHGANSCSFDFNGIRVLIEPSPNIPGLWRVLFDPGDGPHPVDQRLRAVARQITADGFDAECDDLRARVIEEEVNAQSFVNPPHFWRDNAMRFSAVLRDPLTGMIKDWPTLRDRMCDKANLSIAHGSAVPYLYFPTSKDPIPHAQLAVPMNGLGVDPSRPIYLVLRLNSTPWNNAPRVVCPTVLSPGMLANNTRILSRLREFWRADCPLAA